MSTDAKQDRLDELFIEAAALPGEERHAFLNEACEGDDAMRAELEQMLAVHDQGDRATEDFIPPPDQRLYNGAAPPRDPLIGRRIGAYEVIRRLGSGGFGAVYLGFRSDNYKQKVAIKVLRSDKDVNDRDLARFDLERQLLADFQHDKISRLLYGGTLDTCRPYIVMEYVKGHPITEYCDAKRLPISDRLALFRQVCEAVAYAHRFGAIHRDIKPSNIFVDEAGNVKLLDFGIAKMIDPITQKRMLTVSEGGMPLTPEYASPEQVRSEGISTASDVYSLGVVLYELLTGRRPYDLIGLPWHEVVRVISEVEPRHLSSAVLEDERIRRDDDTIDIRSAETLAHPRATNPKQLHKHLKGDLEQVVLKALRKESKHRYPTVDALMRDIERFERGETVAARPVRASEKLQKWVRRNRAAAALSSALIVALIAGTLISTFFAIAERRQAEIASKREADAIAAKLEAEATIDSLAQSYLKSGRERDALKLREQIYAAKRGRLGPQHTETIAAQWNVLEAMRYLAEELRESDSPEDAIDLYTPTLITLRTSLGSTDARTVEALENLAHAYSDAGQNQKAAAAYEEVLAARQQMLKEGDPLLLRAIQNASALWMLTGRSDEAIRAAEELVAWRKNSSEHDLDLSDAIVNLACAYVSAGNIDDGIRMHEQALELRKNLLGDEDENIRASLYHLSYAYFLNGKLEKAIQYGEDAVDQLGFHSRLDHPETMHNLLLSKFAGDQVNASAKIAYFEYEMFANAFATTRVEGKRRLIDKQFPIGTLSVISPAIAQNGTQQFDVQSLNPYAPIDVINSVLHRGKPVDFLYLNAGIVYLGSRQRALLTLSDVYWKIRRADGTFDFESADINELSAAYLNKALSKGAYLALCEKMSASSWAWYYIAQLSDVEGARDEAIEAFEKCIAIPQEYGLLVNALARWRLQQLKAEAAVARTLEPIKDEARSYLSAGETDLAIPLIEEVLIAQRAQLGAANADTLLTVDKLQDAYLAVGRKRAALELNLEYQRFSKAQLIASDGSDELVTLLIERACSQDMLAVASAEDATIVGELRHVAGAFKEATEAIRWGMTVGRSDPYMYKSLGVALLAQGDHHGAKVAFEQALKNKRRGDGTLNVSIALSAEELTAAFFLDIVTEEDFARRTSHDTWLASSSWFYVAQRREIAADKVSAIEAYERCIESGKPQAHIRCALAKWRLKQLRAKNE